MEKISTHTYVGMWWIDKGLKRRFSCSSTSAERKFMSGRKSLLTTYLHYYIISPWLSIEKPVHWFVCKWPSSKLYGLLWNGDRVCTAGCKVMESWKKMSLLWYVHLTFPRSLHITKLAISIHPYTFHGKQNKNSIPNINNITMFFDKTIT